jgi:hypothetical protein
VKEKQILRRAVLVNIFKKNIVMVFIRYNVHLSVITDKLRIYKGEEKSGRGASGRA